jgi:hypothetical protein
MTAATTGSPGGQRDGYPARVELEPGPVDALLDEMFDRLAGTGAAGRRALAEAEDHLRTATADGVARGLSEQDAQAEAVTRFGPPARIAGELRRTHLGVGDVLRRTFVGAWFVGALGLLAMGLSGLLNEAFGQLVSPEFVAGDASGVTYTPERCSDYYEYVPDAHSCAQAAAVHHWGEVVDGRVAAGVLGLLALLVLVVARRTVLRGPRWSPPAGYVSIVLLALFGVVGAALGGLSLMQLAFGEHAGVGVGLADGLVAGLVALVVAIVVLRRIRARAASR